MWNHDVRSNQFKWEIVNKFFCAVILACSATGAHFFLHLFELHDLKARKI